MAPRSTLGKEPDWRPEVLVALVHENREEIRFWQDRLIQASFWFNAAILALLSFGLEKAPNPELRRVSTVGVVCLAMFYNVFATVARRAVAMSGQGLLGFETALRLCEKDAYLAGRCLSRYNPRWLPQRYIVLLRLLNLLIVVVGLYVLCTT